jgi:hypothetical protein
VPLGSDDGLKKGNTLEVYRLDPPKYLGAVRIVEVTPKKAVANPVEAMLGAVKTGDRVASQILGK